MKNGQKGARDALAAFWFEISRSSVALPWMANPFERFFSGWNLDGSLGYSAYDMVSRAMSPYQFNPLNINPLKHVLEKVLDVDLVQACSVIKLFVAATSVRTGHARVFQCHEVTIDALLASACIPFIFQAVEIDEEPYWDGGYMGNPAIWPLIYHANAQDVLLVQINPLERLETPKTASEIINRMNEINFNSSLIAEMRAIHFVSRLVQEHKLDSSRYKDLRMHMVSGCDAMRELNASSKLNADWRFFELLRDIGRDAADNWLQNHADAIGSHSSLDVKGAFLCANEIR